MIFNLSNNEYTTTTSELLKNWNSKRWNKYNLQSSENILLSQTLKDNEIGIGIGILKYENWIL